MRQTGHLIPMIVPTLYSILFTPDQSALALEDMQRPQSGQVSQGQFQTQVTYPSPMKTGALHGAAITPDGGCSSSAMGSGCMSGTPPAEKCWR